MRKVLGEVTDLVPDRSEVLDDPAERVRRLALERSLYLAIQDLIDTGAYILAREGWEMPGTYRDAIEELGKHGVLPSDFAFELASIAGFRNVLEHGYVELDTDLLFAYASDLGDFERFARYVLEYAERHGG
jgi:uncharacterized protein YutE (UPF0331/DUF86 family)